MAIRESIKADVGYKVFRLTEEAKELYSWQVGDMEDSESFRALVDGEKLVMLCVMTDLARYLDERVGNEMFHLCEFFRTKRYMWAYWRDEETDIDYITRLEEINP